MKLVYSWNKTSAYVYTTYVQKDKILVPNSLYVQKRVFSSPDISAAYHAPHCYFACYLNQLLVDQFVIFNNNTNVQNKAACIERAKEAWSNVCVQKKYKFEKEVILDA